MPPLQICSVTAEVAPFSKTGGLGDVAAALPPALTALGHRVLTVAPRYRAYPEAWDTGIRLHFPLFGHVHEVALFHARVEGHGDIVFVDHPAICRGGIYGDDHGAYSDNLFRFALLSRAAIEVSRRLGPGGGGTPLADAGPVRFLTHDWHTGLLPVYLRAHYQANGLLTDATSVHVIHNLAHQGNAAMSAFAGLDLPAAYAPTVEMDGLLNCMKAGLVSADRLVTVSPTYAREVTTPAFGCGLDGVLRSRSRVLTGILNGIDPDTWNPRVDPHLPQTYGPEALSDPPDPTTRGPVGGKAACKSALQREVGLPTHAHLPVVGFVGRLTGQKGIELLEQVGHWLAHAGAAQLVLLGTGEARYESALAALQRRWPGRVAARLAFDNGLAHRITAGADILVMPSRFEPCGLNQLYALAYGTVPVVHATGGLADTVPSFDPDSDTGLGWAFSPPTPAAFRQALGYAITTWHQHPATFRRIARRGMAPDRGWGPSAARYAAVLAQ